MSSASSSPLPTARSPSVRPTPRRRRPATPRPTGPARRSASTDTRRSTSRSCSSARTRSWTWRSRSPTTLTDGSLRTSDGSSAYVYRSNLALRRRRPTPSPTPPPASSTATTATAPSSRQTATRSSPAGRSTSASTTSRRAVHETRSCAARSCQVIVWTFVFAILSVALCFAPRALPRDRLQRSRGCAGKKFYRVLLILPVRVPGVPVRRSSGRACSTPSSASSTRCCFGGAEIPWLTDPWLARFSVLVVNLWLGFPYMFLVCTGALQSIPDEIERGRPHRRRGPVAGRSARSSCRCCWSRWRRC